MIFNSKKKITILYWRLFYSIIISSIIIVSDIKYNISLKIHNYLDYSYIFLHWLINIPNQEIKNILQSIKNNKQLILKNNSLHKELALKNSELLLMEYYKQENYKLRELLSSPLFTNEKKTLCQILYKNINLYHAQVIIDKGSNDNVYIGQPVINNQGIIGQVIATNTRTSRVLLICDTTHALPVQILRNNIRMILKGNGYNKNLQSEYFSNNKNIKIGDILVTSGLGGRFPVGYPVAVISSIEKNIKTNHNVIAAKPIVKLHQLCHLLLLWNTEEHITSPLSEDSVHRITNKRFNMHQSN